MTAEVEKHLKSEEEYNILTNGMVVTYNVITLNCRPHADKRGNQSFWGESTDILSV
ncbi:hypothetical protein PCURB6_19540 [Paenibacillus curdlanolyticus]|nr:hypothetical protein PCURB6_19540 [Paenibacillus curdlanolyticus]